MGYARSAFSRLFFFCVSFHWIYAKIITGHPGQHNRHFITGNPEQHNRHSTLKDKISTSFDDFYGHHIIL